MKIPVRIFKVKYKISTAVIIENPVRSPIVPPIAESISTNLAARSLVMIEKTGEPNLILMNIKSCLLSSSKREIKQMLDLSQNHK